MPSHHRKLLRNQLGPAPRLGLPVETMDDQLIVGVFSDLHSEGGFLMVVDCRVSLQAAALPNRTVSIAIAPACGAVTVVSPSRKRMTSLEFEWSRDTGTLTLNLAAGSGALVRVSGEGCGTLLRGVRGTRDDL